MHKAYKESIAIAGVSPRELGWQASSVRTALIDEPIGIRAKEGLRGETIYVCKFRPLKGEWLGQALSSATAEPNAPVSSGVIRGDWILYQKALQEQAKIERGELSQERIKYGHAQLLRIHISDPNIGRSMTQFGAEYVDRWLQALDDNNAALQKAFRPFEIIDGSCFPEVYVREQEDSHEQLGGRFLHQNPELSLAVPFREKYYPDSHGLNWRKFEREEFLEFVRWLKEEFPDRNRLYSYVIPHITLFEGRDIIDTFPQNPRDTWGFDLHYAYMSHPEDERYAWISSDHPRRWPNYTISDDEIVLYEADTQVTINLERTDDQARPFRITGQKVHFTDTTNAISPTMAWRRRQDPANGTIVREFLTKEEIDEHFAPEFDGETLDDLLGLITMVGFMPTVQTSTPTQMHLKDERDEVRKEGGQRITAAQIPVFYNRQNLREQIALDPDNVLTSIERMHSSF